MLIVVMIVIEVTRSRRNMMVMLLLVVIDMLLLLVNQRSRRIWRRVLQKILKLYKNGTPNNEIEIRALKISQRQKRVTESKTN